MTAHSRYGGSTAHRWGSVDRCPASAHLGAFGRESTNPSAERGTAMHLYAAKVLDSEAVTTEGLSDDELGLVAGYVDAITDLERGKTLIRFIETMVEAPGIHPEAFGSIDYLAWEESTKTLYIVDLKTGRSEVDAKDNMQLIFYALAAFETFKWPVAHFVLGIYQPLKSTQIDWWIPDTAEVIGHFPKMNAAAKSTAMHAGEWCKYCPIDGRCGVQTDAIRGLVKTPVVVMSPKQVADAYDMLDQLQTWMKAIETEADELAKTGALPDHHLVEGKARALAWKSPENAAVQLRQLGLDESVTHTPPQPPALKTPTQIAKAIGKDGASQLASIAERPPSNMIIVRSTTNEVIRSLTDW